MSYIWAYNRFFTFCFVLFAGLWKVAVVTGQSDDCNESRQQDKSVADTSQGEINAGGEEHLNAEDKGQEEKEDGTAEQIQQLEDVSSKENAEKGGKKEAGGEEPEVSVDAKKGSPTCRLVMVLYGDLGQTRPFFLGDNESVSETKFLPGIADNFIVSFCLI